jgi:hypothetical protein
MDRTEHSDAASGLSRFVRAIERRTTSPWTPFAAAIWIGGIRVLEEYQLVFVPAGLRREPLPWIGHTALFYLAVALGVAAVVRWAGRRELGQAIAAASAGLVVGVLPPVIDAFVYEPGGFRYGYRTAFFDGFPPLFYDPPYVTPLGEAISVWLSMLLVVVYLRVVRTPWWRVGAAAALHYALIVLFLAIIPSASLWLHAVVREIALNESAALALLAAVVGAYLTLRPELARHLAMRLPHALLAPSLVLVGSALVGRLNGDTAVAAALMFVTALSFLAQNDWYDRAEDAAAGRPVLVGRDDVVFFALLPVGLWLVTATAHVWPTLCALLFTVVAFAYHGDPFRLKCVFPLSYKTEALFAALCVAAGIFTHDRVPLGWRELAAGALVAAGASVVAMLKDAKDEAADRAAGIRTVYVVLGARGWSTSRIDALVLVAVGASMAVPPLYLAGSTDVARVALLGLLALATPLSQLLVKPRRLAAPVAMLLLCAFLVLAATSVA